VRSVAVTLRIQLPTSMTIDSNLPLEIGCTTRRSSRRGKWPGVRNDTRSHGDTETVIAVDAAR
jgi:hypothetical protein